MVFSIEAMNQESFSSMARQMGRWVNHVLGQQYHRFCPGDAWAPAVNFYEGPDGYCVVVELAGVPTETIDLRIEEGRMMISGQREVPEPPGCSGSVRVRMMEIDHGRFSRKLDLPDDVDVDASVNLSANYSNGFLWIQLPRKRRVP
jgi:HSP20 family protein